MALQYQVPQFVDVEDKIFGPLTAKQFLMFVMTFLIIGALWYSPLPKQATIILAVPIIIFTLLLAFYKVNGRTFLWFLYAILHFFFTGKMFLWERRGDAARIRMGSSEMAEKAALKRNGALRTPLSESRIQGLARILDTAGRVVDEDAPTPPGF
jgi:hypothetical protein